MQVTTCAAGMVHGCAHHHYLRHAATRSCGHEDTTNQPVSNMLNLMLAVAAEQRIQLGKVTWQAQARIDARGVRGDTGVPAEFDRCCLVWSQC